MEITTRDFNISPRMEASRNSSLKVTSRRTPMTIDNSGEKVAMAVAILVLSRIRNQGGTLVSDKSIDSLATKIMGEFSEDALGKIASEAGEVISWLQGAGSMEDEGQRIQESFFSAPDYVFSMEDTVPVIDQAIEEETDLFVDYYSRRRGQFTVRRVTPIRLTGEELTAFCHLRGDMRVFKLSRIRSVKPVCEEE
jgi:predicted DNA-binding transcriptional regulator YafY